MSKQRECDNQRGIMDPRNNKWAYLFSADNLIPIIY